MSVRTGSVVASAVGLALLTGCAVGPARSSLIPPPAPPQARFVYVAVGASETVGVGSPDPLRDAWTAVFYRTALPPSATFVNLGVPGATSAQALQQEVPYAVSLRPTLVTVWLNVNDLVQGVSAADYEASLTSLLTALRRGGRTRVLVANTPPLTGLPAYRLCRPPFVGSCPLTEPLPPPRQVDAQVAAYNRAIAQAAASVGAQVVDLHALVLRHQEDGTEAGLVSGDGFHPNDAGYRDIAAAFAAAYRRRG
jgi:lysophospholipase L1-like esterase